MAKRPLSKLVNLVESASTSAPVEKQFITDLLYSIEHIADSSSYTPSRTFKPSSIGGCPRNIYYQLIGAETQKEGHSSATNVGILESGTDRHERIQKAICDMKKSGIDCEYIDIETFVKSRGLDYIEIKGKSGIETRCFWKDIPLSFLTDGIIRYKGKYYILEIKTMNMNKFIESRDVRDEHKSQGICYSMAFGIEDVLYLYECRDTLAKKAFIYHVTDEMRGGLMNKINYIKQCVADGTPPEVEGNRNKCRYCNYQHICEKKG